MDDDDLCLVRGQIHHHCEQIYAQTLRGVDFFPRSVQRQQDEGCEQLAH